MVGTYLCVKIVSGDHIGHEGFVDSTMYYLAKEGTIYPQVHVVGDIVDYWIDWKDLLVTGVAKGAED